MWLNFIVDFDFDLHQNLNYNMCTIQKALFLQHDFSLLHENEELDHIFLPLICQLTPQQHPLVLYNAKADNAKSTLN